MLQIIACKEFPRCSAGREEPNRAWWCPELRRQTSKLEESKGAGLHREEYQTKKEKTLLREREPWTSVDSLESLAEDGSIEIYEETTKTRERTGRISPRTHTKLGIDSGSTG